MLFFHDALVRKMASVALPQILKANCQQWQNMKILLGNMKYPSIITARHISYKIFTVDKKCLYSLANFKCSPVIFKQRNIQICQPSGCFPLYQNKYINILRHFSKSSSNNFPFEKKKQSTLSLKNKSTLYYIIAIGIFAVGLSYAAVPLYRIFCQAYSYGGTTKQEGDSSKVLSMVRRDDREITIRFNADTAAAMTWNFRPQQTEVKVRPGETALAFYSARNPTDRQVTGISTYNVVPFDAGQYFNKIQCFCFEEQMLNPKEEVSMPVFFYIDPEFAEDPSMEYVTEIILSYTFFEVKAGLKLPFPNFGK